MKRFLTPLLSLLLFFTLTAEKCDKDGGASTMPAAASLIGTKWNLASLAGEAIRLPEGIENPYLSLAQDNQVSGFGGCNRLMGSMKLDGAALSFPNVGGTKMYCEKSQSVETSFMNALRATNSYKLDGDKLTLLDKSKELATLIKGK